MKVRRNFTPKKASDESVALGQGAPDAPNPVSDFVDAPAAAAAAAAKKNFMADILAQARARSRQ